MKVDKAFRQAWIEGQVHLYHVSLMHGLGNLSLLARENWKQTQVVDQKINHLIKGEWL